jgi:hypothetical protein
MDNAGNCDTTAQTMGILIPTFKGEAWHLRCCLHILNLVAKVHLTLTSQNFNLPSIIQIFISFFFKPQIRKKQVKVSAGTKCKRESSSRAKEVIEEATELSVQPVHDEDIALIEDALEPPAADDGQGVHDEQVVNNLRTRAIQAMADQGICILEEDNQTALGLFPKVRYWSYFFNSHIH